MKKLILLSIGAAICSVASAQSVSRPDFSNLTMASEGRQLAGKTTGVYHDSLVMANISATDTIALYYANAHTDSGYFFGTSIYQYNGFAERYDFNSADSNVQVLGTLSWFGGTVNPSSTKNVTFKVWSAGTMVSTSTSRPHLFFSGFPAAKLDSVNVSIHNLGINIAAGSDSTKAHYFATPTAVLTTSFFVGYTINYNGMSLGGDTIGVRSTLAGTRHGVNYNVSGADTIINNQNTTLDSGSWLDNGSQLGFYANLVIFPIVKIYNFLSVNGINNKNLTFFGNYPNPATNETNIKFSLAVSSDVTIDIMDVSGRTVQTVNEKNLTAGEHTIAVATNNLPTGEYIYVVRSSNGGGIASKLTIAK